jgi:hypothetical protein
VPQLHVATRGREHGEGAVRLHHRALEHLLVGDDLELGHVVVHVRQGEAVAEQLPRHREREAGVRVQLAELRRAPGARGRELQQRAARADQLRVRLAEVVPGRVREGVRVERALVDVIGAGAGVDELIGDQPAVEVGPDVGRAAEEVVEVADGGGAQRAGSRRGGGVRWADLVGRLDLQQSLAAASAGDGAGEQEGGPDGAREGAGGAAAHGGARGGAHHVVARSALRGQG